jgi:peptidoglycan/xylan/chitin deacetylase (PgdA/CDA1 family)
MKAFYFVLIAVTAISAAGPSRVALIDRSVSPVKLNSVEQFNLAGRIEIISALSALSNLPENETDTAIAVRLGLKKVNRASVVRWWAETGSKLLDNYQSAIRAASIPNVIFPLIPAGESLKKASFQIAEAYPAWSKALEAFYSDYWYEQERLAALWPSVTSEIFMFDTTCEVNGTELPDLTFKFTFDDGPTPPNGPGNEIIALLRAKNIPAIFFVLSDKLNEEKRVRGIESLKNQYAGMTLGSHGQIHSPFPKLPDPGGALEHSFLDIRSVFNQETMFFRPPYGQRTAAFVRSVCGKTPVIMLWNIDSQDWRNELTARQIADRTITLMVLNRRGIVLFHELYSRSAKAVEIVCNSVGCVSWK